MGIRGVHFNAVSYISKTEFVRPDGELAFPSLFIPCSIKLIREN